MVNPDDKSQLPQLNTLNDLINFFTDHHNNKSYAAFNVFDMGRHIIEMSNEDFNRFEQTEIPWPTPLLQSAWFALIFSDPKNAQDHFWFLKFPLDEQGKLVQAARDEYIAQFLQQIADKNLTIENSSKIESPYGFKPSEEKLANINAKYKVKKNLQPSNYFTPVVQYFLEAQWHNWQMLGYQGIADFCSRLNTQSNNKESINNQTLESLLLNSFTFLPVPMISYLSSALEHHKLSKSIYSLWIKQLDHKQLISQINTLRVISFNNYSKQQAHYIEQCLTGPFRSNIELLALVSGRNWLYLKDNKLMLLYLEALANNEDSEQNFVILLQDLVFVPGMREHVLSQFRNPKRSDKLSQAIGHFYGMSR